VPPLRLLFFGTPEIAVPTLERLIAGPHEVVGVVSQPDRARGRGRKESPSPVSSIALREGLPLVRPEHVGDDEVLAELSALQPDAGVVVAFGQFLPKKVRELPGCGYLINAHASLLPKYRGASPIAQAILDGEAETGVSVMRIEREMDSGPVALVRRTPIEERENTAELSARLSEIAATAIGETLAQIEREAIEWTEQDARLATIAPKIEKSDAILDLRESADRLACRIHALSPKPGGALTLVTKGGESGNEGVGRASSDVAKGSKHSKASGEAMAADGTTLKITRAEVAPFDAAGQSVDGASEVSPGTIELDEGGCALRIATGQGWLVPLTLQRPGGKPLVTKDFLRGFRIGPDMCFALSVGDKAESR
jgi:methionyl-tRNA formyltransferase